MSSRLDERTTRTSDQDAGRVLGWLSGLGLLVAPVIAAGVVATALGMLEDLLVPGATQPVRLDAEHTFPWLYLAAFVAGLGWIAYGSVRIPGFRRGGIPGTAITVALLAGIWVVGRVVQ